MATTWYTPIIANATYTTTGIYKSTDDAVTWTLVTNSTLPATYISIQPYGFRVFPDKTFLLVGRDNSGNTVIFTSSDLGVTWTTKQILALGNAARAPCFLGDDIQVLFDQSDASHVKTIASTDRFTTFTRSAALGNYNVHGITRIPNNKFVFAIQTVSDNRTYVSADGFTWGASLYQMPYNTKAAAGGTGYAREVITLVDQHSPAVTAVLKGGTQGMGPWTAIVSTANDATTSPDGAISRTTPENFGEPGGHLIYAGDVNGNSWTTLDDITWTSHVTNSPIIAGSAPTWIQRLADTGTYMMSYNNTFYRSIDGITFTSVSFNSPGISAPLYAFVNDLQERPHQVDRGLPIEIAGPRNDVTRLAYLPFVRIFR